MGKQIFRFKQFSILQDQTAMKVGTDGVLLGAWADIENAYHILDIGTGTGLIALMAAQRNPGATIDAVEINPEACAQAIENRNNSPWADRIHIHHTSIFDFFPPRKYDSIICNPPFFINSTHNPDENRTVARHCENFSHKELIKKAATLLTPEGNFYAILPPAEALRLIAYATEEKLHTVQITQIRPTPEKPPKRFLLKISAQPGKTQTNELILEVSRHQLTEECFRLTKDFYLHL